MAVNRKLSVLLVLVFGMAVIGNIWAQTDNRLNGRWVGSIDGMEMEYIFNNGNYEQYINNRIEASRGTYTTRDGRLTLTSTHVGGGVMTLAGIPGYESRWYTNDEFITVTRRVLLGLGYPEVLVDMVVNEMLADINLTQNYSLEGNSLTLSYTEDGESMVINLTRR